MNREFTDDDRYQRGIDLLAPHANGPPISAKMKQFIRGVRESVSDVDLEPSQELERLARAIDAARRNR